MNKSTNYEDIINLPHHISTRHPQMDIQSRAAQFAPFAALTGYDDNIKEATRLTTQRIELDEQEKLLLDKKINLILNNIEQKTTITITYFVKDNLKSGGKYIDINGIIKTIDITKGYIILKDKTKIPINDIINITSKLLEKYQID